jgi:hypothetical protein
MKPLLAVGLLVFCVAVSHAEDKPRFFETGFSVTADLSNNRIALFDLLKDKIELHPESFSKEGFLAAASSGIEVFYRDFRFEPYGIRFFIGGEVLGAGEFPRDTLDFLFNEEAVGNYSGEASFGGSAFVNVGAEVSRKFGNWKIGVSPAIYIPLFYIPYDGFRYTFSNIGGVTNADVHFTAAVYSPFALGGEKGGLGAFVKSAGFDVGISAEYPLLSHFDLGAKISGIPLYPSTPAYKTRSSINLTLVDFKIEDLFGQNYDFYTMENETVYSSNSDRKVIRPLRFDVYGIYRPLETDFLVFVPMLGLSALTFYGNDKVLFNAGLECSVRYPAFLTSSLSVEYREKVWREKLGAAFRFRHVAFNLGIGLSSPDFVKSFTGRGFSVDLGLSFAN